MRKTAPANEHNKAGRLRDIVAPRRVPQVDALQRAWGDVSTDERLRFLAETLTPEERQRLRAYLTEPVTEPASPGSLSSEDAP